MKWMHFGMELLKTVISDEVRSMQDVMWRKWRRGRNLTLPKHLVGILPPPVFSSKERKHYMRPNRDVYDGLNVILVLYCYRKNPYLSWCHPAYLSFGASLYSPNNV
jgi:hypothetical protein